MFRVNNKEHISHLVLVFLLLTLGRKMPAGNTLLHKRLSKVLLVLKYKRLDDSKFILSMRKSLSITLGVARSHNQPRKQEGERRVKRKFEKGEEPI